MTIGFAEGVHQECTDLVLLGGDLQEVLSVEQDGHVINIVLEHIKKVVFIELHSEVV